MKRVDLYDFSIIINFTSCKKGNDLDIPDVSMLVTVELLQIYTVLTIVIRTKTPALV